MRDRDERTVRWHVPKERKKRAKNADIRKPDAGWLTFAIVVFEVTAFLLLALRDGGIDPAALLFAVLLPALLGLQAAILSRFFPYMDKYLFIMTQFLCALGLIMLYRLGEEKAYKQFLAYGIGSLSQIITMLVISKFKRWWSLRYVIMGASVVLLLLALLLGKERNGAQNWIQFSGFSMQPSEFVKAAVPIVLATYLSRGEKLHRMLPAGIYVVTCVLLLVFQKDLGAVFIYFAVAIVMYYISTSDLLLTLGGLLCAVAGAVVSYWLFPHVRTRVANWRNPWIAIDTSGYQTVQALMAIGTGGIFGMGLGEGLPRSIPVYDSDFIFAVICEEFGVLMGLCVLALYVLIIMRGVLLAQRSRDSFSALLSFGVTTVFAVQTFLIVGGVINMIPLTGVTLPFISNGGSSMISCLTLTGILEGVSITQGEQEAREWRRARAAMRWENDI